MDTGIYICMLRVKICDTVVSRPSRDSAITKEINFRRKFCARSFRTYEDLSFRRSRVSDSRIPKRICLRQTRKIASESLPVFIGHPVAWRKKKGKRNAMEMIMIIVITRRRFISSICRAIYHYYLVNNVTTISG